jgi:hypothetical protein
MNEYQQQLSLYNQLPTDIKYAVICQLHNPKMFGRTNKAHHAIVNEMINNNFMMALRTKDPEFLMTHYVPIILVDLNADSHNQYRFSLIDPYDTKRYNQAYKEDQRFQQIRKERLDVAIHNKKYQLGCLLDEKDMTLSVGTWHEDIYTLISTMSDKQQINLKVYSKSVVGDELFLEILMGLVGNDKKKENLACILKGEFVLRSRCVSYLTYIIHTDQQEIFELLFDYYITKYKQQEDMIRLRIGNEICFNDYYDIVEYALDYANLLSLADKHNNSKAFQVLAEMYA